MLPTLIYLSHFRLKANKRRVVKQVCLTSTSIHTKRILENEGKKENTQYLFPFSQWLELNLP